MATEQTNWILLIESEQGASQTTKNLMLEAGYKVLTCIETARSHQFLLNQKFACVVVDHDAKNIGTSVIAPIKRNPYHLNHQTPVILMSETLEPTFLRKIAAHIEAAFLKPVSSQLLMEKVNSLIRNKADA